MSEQINKHKSFIIATLVALFLTTMYQCTSTKAQDIWNLPDKVKALEQKHEYDIEEIKEQLKKNTEASIRAELAAKSNHELLLEMYKK